MYTAKKPHIHFLGIGGIGMSGIATILAYQGYQVSGCDLDVEQKSVKDLTSLGCSVYHGNNSIECRDSSIDVLVYSSALKADNPEIMYAQQRGIPTIPRALMLAELMRTKYSIAISGAHGKTTTTSMISHILIEAKYDPTVIIGGHLKNISTNARFGAGEFLVAEADESDKSFLRLNPTIAVVTNIDLEHLDVYKDLNDIKETFTRFLGNLPFYGKAFICTDNPQAASLLPISHIKTIKYGTNREADIQAHDIILGPRYSTATIWKKGEPDPLGSLYLTMPGQHNILNATAAIAVALDLDIPFSTITTALANFKGIDRRFTYKGLYKSAEIFDDYGHHPTEIYHTLQVARKRTQEKLIVAFQPHRYSRTQGLWSDFIKVFCESGIDHLVVTDIYAASEAPIANITSEQFVRELKQHNPSFTVTYIPYEDKFTQIHAHLDTIIKPNDLLLLLGAGKMNKIADYLK
jgi:UDP-N-acetylmuramate--alanine ligase